MKNIYTINKLIKIILLSLSIFSQELLLAQTNNSNFPVTENNNPVIWKFQTGNKIYSSPIVHKNIIYFGSLDKNFYAINAKTGDEIWRYTASHPISSTAAIQDSIICFENGNQLIGINIYTGRQQWRFNPEGNNPTLMFDPWDYYHSSPVINNNIAYYGDEYGHITGINIHTGELSFQHTTENGSAIRSTPAIYNNRVFFGDWDGIIYSVHLLTSNVQWQKNTFTGGKPYPTFGGITSRIIINNGNLYYGARNPNIYAYIIDNGYTKWSFVENNGGWIVSTPLIDNETLYIGGSDNLNLYALNSESGYLSWKYNAGLNIFATPIVANNFVFICTGNAYEPGIGNGSVYSINKYSHSLETQYQAGGSIFSSPLLYDGVLYFGCNDNYLYALDSRYFGNTPVAQIELNTDDMNLGNLSSTLSSIDTSFYISNKGGLSDSININIDYINVTETENISVSPDSFEIFPTDSVLIKLSILPDKIGIGEYSIDLIINSKNNSDIKQFKRKVNFNISDLSGTHINRNDKDLFSLDAVYPNPFTHFTTFRYTLYKPAKVNLQLFNMQGQKISSLINEFQSGGSKTYILNGFNQNKNIFNSGIYLYQLIVNDQVYKGKVLLIR
ncbi:PQQ-binding-like beta-propeller repeat protein [Bacteroidota bacterium]